MAFRLYITPTTGAGTQADPRRPLHFDGFQYGAMDYGFQPIYLVAADLTAPQDAAILANADVFAFPFDLNTNVGGGGVQAARDALEAALIPAQWVGGSQSWLFIARTVAGMFQYMQRLNGILGNTVLIDDSTKLNVQWSSIPSNIQTAMTSAASSFGYTFNPQPNDQIRTLLKDLADQWGSQNFRLGPFTF